MKNKKISKKDAIITSQTELFLKIVQLILLALLEQKGRALPPL